jgi:hypothetical protein
MDRADLVPGDETMTASKQGALHPENFPMLSQFVSGYLHQDFMLDYRTPAEALVAFLKDASVAERTQFRREAARFAKESAQLAWADARRAFEALGGAWSPSSRRGLVALLARAELTRAARRSADSK